MTNNLKETVQSKKRIISKYSGRELQLEDNQCEQLAETFFQIPDKYYVLEQMFLRLFVFFFI